MQNLWNLLKKTYEEWSEDHAPRLAAALSYYTAFSIAPILVIAIAVVGLFYQREAAQEHLLAQVGGLAGTQARELMAGMLQASQNLGSNLWAVVLGTAALIFGATGVFVQLQEALNTMWEVEARPEAGVWGLVRTRLVSFAMVVSVGFLLLVSLLISAFLSALGQWGTGLLPGGGIFIQTFNQIVSLVVITGLFALVFKYVPDAKIAWKDVWLGALFTAVLFSIGKYVIGLYLGNSGVMAQFGAAGSLAVLLLWVYYSAQITFFGAEFTQTYANLYGSRIVPDENAVYLEAPNQAASSISRPLPLNSPQRPPESVFNPPAVPVKVPPGRRLPGPPVEKSEIGQFGRREVERSLVAFISVVTLTVGLITGWFFGKTD